MQNKLNVAICEDDSGDAGLLSDMIRRGGLYCNIDYFTDAECLLAKARISKYDLFLLDIYLGGMSGIELARRIRAKNDKCELVFTTVSDAHALEGFEVGALQYLVKPLDAQKVAEMCNRFIRIIDRRDLHFITVVVDRLDVKVHYRDICHIEAFDKYCKIHTPTEVIETYTTMAKMLEKLPNPPFLRCHRSHVVNMDHVRDMESNFVMDNGDIVPISRPELEEAKNAYMKYLVDNARRKSRDMAFC